MANSCNINSAGIVSTDAVGTFSGRTLTQPAAGITISNANGVSGNPTLALANDLLALENLPGTGFAVRTAADTWNQRTITGTSNQIAVTNGNGVTSNPSLALTSDIYVDGISFDSGTNVLATYENGTFVPAVTSATPPTTITFSTASGRYIKIGKLVQFQIELVTSAFTLGPGTGTITITGLPFTAVSTDISILPCAVHFNNINVAAGTINVIGDVVENTTTMLLLTAVDAGAGAGVDISGWASNTSLWVSGSYEATT